MASVLEAEVIYENGDVETSFAPRMAVGAPGQSPRRVRKLVLKATLHDAYYVGEYDWSLDAEREVRAEALALYWTGNKCHLKSACDGRVLNVMVAGRPLWLFRSN